MRVGVEGIALNSGVVRAVSTIFSGEGSTLTVLKEQKHGSTRHCFFHENRLRNKVISAGNRRKKE